MKAEQFKHIESRFYALKNKLEKGEISTEQMRNELKQMMIRGDDGTFWMIGGKSGKWYYYNGSKWIRKDPEVLVNSRESEDHDSVKGTGRGDSGASSSEGGNEEYSIGEDKKGDSETLRLQQEDSSRKSTGNEDSDSSDPSGQTLSLDREAATTRVKPLDREAARTRVQPALTRREESPRRKPKPAAEGHFRYHKNEIEIKSLRISSVVFFMGGVGILLGVILGAIFGVLNVFNEVQSFFPAMLQEARGKLQGGLIFGALGGIAFALIHMVIAVVAGLVYNMIASLLGGIRFKMQ